MITKRKLFYVSVLLYTASIIEIFNTSAYAKKMPVMYWPGNEFQYQNSYDIYGIKKAAEEGDLKAMDDLGDLYCNGQAGIEKNCAEAIKWWKKAAEKGDARAQKDLGTVYMMGGDDGKNIINGMGGIVSNNSSANIEEAIKWNTKAAEQENLEAETNLVLIYTTGIGVPKDNKKALEWCSKTGERGDLSCQQRLIAAYTNGDGVPKDEKRARYWRRKNIVNQASYFVFDQDLNVAVEEFLSARNNPNYLLYHPDHPEMRSIVEAAKQMAASEGKNARTYVPKPELQKALDNARQEAAEKGDAKAQIELGYLSLRKEDFVHAYLWFHLAAADKATDKISKENIQWADNFIKNNQFDNALTATELKEATKLLNNWQPKL